MPESDCELGHIAARHQAAMASSTRPMPLLYVGGVHSGHGFSGQLPKRRERFRTARCPGWQRVAASPAHSTSSQELRVSRRACSERAGTEVLRVLSSWLRPFVLNCIDCLLERSPLLFPLGGWGGFGRYDEDGTAEKDSGMGCDGVGCLHLIAFTLSPIRGR